MTKTLTKLSGSATCGLERKYTGFELDVLYSFFLPTKLTFLKVVQCQTCEWPVIYACASQSMISTKMSDLWMTRHLCIRAAVYDRYKNVRLLINGSLKLLTKLNLHAGSSYFRYGQRLLLSFSKCILWQKSGSTRFAKTIKFSKKKYILLWNHYLWHLDIYNGPPQVYSTKP